jgi:hypothetical protein
MVPEVEPRCKGWKDLLIVILQRWRAMVFCIRKPELWKWKDGTVERTSTLGR